MIVFGDGVYFGDGVIELIVHDIDVFNQFVECLFGEFKGLCV